MAEIKMSVQIRTSAKELRNGAGAGEEHFPRNR
jgi:hypothetical protein